MADKEIKTTLSFETKLKGQQNLGAVDKTIKGVAAALKQIKGLQAVEALGKTLDKSAKSAATLSKNLAGVTQQLQQQSKLTGRAPGVGAGQGGAPGSATGQATATRQAGRVSPFTQGMLQGMGAPRFLQRSGALSQTLGYAAGRAAQGVGNVASSIVTGASGIERGLGGIPLVGGMLAGQFNMASGAANEALELKRQMGGLYQFSAGRNLRSQPELRPRLDAQLHQEINDAVEKQKAEEQRAVGARSLTRLPENERAKYFQQRESVASQASDAFMHRLPETMRSANFADLLGPAGGNGLRGAGERVGLTAKEAVGMASRAAAAGGGDPFSEMGGAAGRLAVSAQRLGVAPEVVGGLTRGARSGAIAGLGNLGQGEIPERVLREVMTSAVRAGVEEADMPDLLRSLNGQVEETRQKGASMHVGALGGLGLGFAALGVGGGPGAKMGAQLQGALSNIGTRGPQGMDFLMLNAFGTANGKGGGSLSPDEMERQRMSLEQGTYATPERFIQFARQRRAAGGGGPAGNALFQAELQKAGVNISTTAMHRLGQGIDSGASTKDLMGMLNEKPGAGLASLLQRAGVEGVAESGTPAQVKRDAEINNQRIVDAGDKMIDAFQNLTDAQTKSLNTSVGVFSQALTDATLMIKDAAYTLGAVVDKMRKAMSE